MKNFLLSLVNASDKAAVTETNMDRIDRSLAYLLTPSLEGDGSPTTNLGPPTTGTHVQDELWVDAALVQWRCTAPGTPGTWFPAIGYRIYRALLTQTGTDAPVATVLENTLGGDVVWSYSDEGTFIATLAGAFPAGKTTDCSGFTETTGANIFTLKRADSDTLALITYQVGAGPINDAIAGSITVTILVYP